MELQYTVICLIAATLYFAGAWFKFTPPAKSIIWHFVIWQRRKHIILLFTKWAHSGVHGVKLGQIDSKLRCTSLLFRANQQQLLKTTKYHQTHNNVCKYASTKADKQHIMLDLNLARLRNYEFCICICGNSIF